MQEGPAASLELGCGLVLSGSGCSWASAHSTLACSSSEEPHPERSAGLMTPAARAGLRSHGACMPGPFLMCFWLGKFRKVTAPF